MFYLFSYSLLSICIYVCKYRCIWYRYTYNILHANIIYIYAYKHLFELSSLRFPFRHHSFHPRQFLRPNMPCHFWVSPWLCPGCRFWHNWRCVQDCWVWGSCGSWTSWQNGDERLLESTAIFGWELLHGKPWQAINAFPATAATAVGCVLLDVLLPHDDRYVLPSLPLCFYLVMPKWFSDAARRSVVVIMVAFKVSAQMTSDEQNQWRFSSTIWWPKACLLWGGESQSLGVFSSPCNHFEDCPAGSHVSPWFHQLVASLLTCVLGNIPKTSKTLLQMNN